MASAGSSGDLPTVAFRLVLEVGSVDEAPSVHEVVAALQLGHLDVYYIEVHPAGDPCEEVGHLYGDPCPRCVGNKRRAAREEEE